MILDTKPLFRLAGQRYGSAGGDPGIALIAEGADTPVLSRVRLPMLYRRPPSLSKTSSPKICGGKGVLDWSRVVTKIKLTSTVTSCQCQRVCDDSWLKS